MRGGLERETISQHWPVGYIVLKMICQEPRGFDDKNAKACFK
jgi:hypothetical protein